MAGETPAPPLEPRFRDADTALERIQAIVANARTIWFALIGFLAFIGLTLVSVRDLDFFSLEATTDLPIVGIAIPTTTFFWTAAWLAAILHVYFHLYLVKLWDALAEAPPEIGGAPDGRRWEMRYGVLTERAGGTPLGDRVFPWLVVDWGLRRRPDRPTTRRPMDLLAAFVTWLVIWLATPLMLAAFWWRSMPAHDARLTLAIGAALLLSLFATLRGSRRARRRLANPGLGDTRLYWRRQLLHDDDFRHLLAVPAAMAVWLLMLATVPLTAVASLAGAGWHHLPAWVDSYADRVWREHAARLWAGIPIFVREDLLSIGRDEPPLVVANLVGAEIAKRPEDWRDYDVARGQFQIAWCRDQDVPLQACQKPTFPDQVKARELWCASAGIDEPECPFRFESIKAAFEEAWQIERAAHLANIVGPNLRGRDLRGALASGAFLTSIDLSEARLERANLSEARLEGANLFSAGLERAVLYRARLEGADLGRAELLRADLFEAQLGRAILSGARLDGAHLFEPQLEGADLRDVSLEGFDLSGAQLQGAELTLGQLEGADLRRARLDGAKLTSANLEQAQLFEAQLERAELFGAKLDGANLRGARLEWADLREAWLKGADLRGAGLEGVDLRGTDLRSIDWELATFGASLADSAVLAGGRNLTQSQLAQVIGDKSTILPLDAETGEQLYVCNCWIDQPPNFDLLLQRSPEYDRDRLRAQWLCPPGVAPQRTGWPAHPEPDGDCGG